MCRLSASAGGSASSEFRSWGERRGNDLLHWRVDDLFHSALLDALLCLGLGVDAPSLVGAVVRRRRYAAPDSEELVLPECAQAALSAMEGAGRAAVCSVKGGHWPPFRVQLNVETQGKRSLTSQTPLVGRLMMMVVVEMMMRHPQRKKISANSQVVTTILRRVQALRAQEDAVSVSASLTKPREPFKCPKHRGSSLEGRARLPAE